MALTFSMLFVAVVEVCPAVVLLQTVVLYHSFFPLCHFMAFFTPNAEDFREVIGTLCCK